MSMFITLITELVSWVYSYAKIDQTAYPKDAQFTVSQLHLNKAIKHPEDFTYNDGAGVRGNIHARSTSTGI